MSYVRMNKRKNTTDRQERTVCQLAYFRGEEVKRLQDKLRNDLSTMGYVPVFSISTANPEKYHMQQFFLKEAQPSVSKVMDKANDYILGLGFKRSHFTNFYQHPLDKNVFVHLRRFNVSGAVACTLFEFYGGTPTIIDLI